MFVSDRSFYMRDPARSLYSTSAYYLSVMTVNAAVTIINAAILLLLTYGMVGECFMSHLRKLTEVLLLHGNWFVLNVKKSLFKWQPTSLTQPSCCC